MKRGLVGTALIVLPVLLAGGFTPLRLTASGHSAPIVWQADGKTGEDECPVGIDSEEIELHIGSLGENGSGSFARVQYIFVNPTASPVGMTLLYPCGLVSAPALIGEEVPVEQDGEPVACRNRFTYCLDRMDAEQAFGQVSAEQREDPFLFPGQTVTRYEIKYRRPEESGRCYLHAMLSFNPAKTCILFDCTGKPAIENGRAHAVWETGDDSGSVSFYAVGEAVDESGVELRFTSDLAGENGEHAILSLGSEKTTFGEFAASIHDGNVIGKTDWYNGLVDLINAKTKSGVLSVGLSAMEEGCFLRWYEYDLTVPAQGSTLNLLTVPFEPVYSRSGSSFFEYFLSPAQKWATFGDLKIDLYTPYYLTDSNLEFEAREGGYSLIRKGLPLGDLNFSLSEEPPKAFDGFKHYPEPIPTLAVALFGLGFTVVSVAVIFTVILVRKKKPAAKQGGAEEGKLPPPPEETHKDP